MYFRFVFSSDIVKAKKYRFYLLNNVKIDYINKVVILIKGE